MAPQEEASLPVTQQVWVVLRPEPQSDTQTTVLSASPGRKGKQGSGQRPPEALESRIRQTENRGTPGTGRRHRATPLPLADFRALRRKARFGQGEDGERGLESPARVARGRPYPSLALELPGVGGVVQSTPPPSSTQSSGLAGLGAGRTKPSGTGDRKATQQERVPSRTHCPRLSSQRPGRGWLG